jgi:MFS transporter, PPP family, 3-phenylpropionic acid transporter
VNQTVLGAVIVVKSNPEGGRRLFPIYHLYGLVSSLIEQKRSNNGGHGTAPKGKRLKVLWLLSFFQFAAVGVYFTYLNVFYHEAGLTGTQIGLVNMSTGMVAVFASILWGNLSDRLGNSRLLLVFGSVGALITAQFFPLVSTFWSFLLLGSLASLMFTSPMTLIDSTTLTLLGDRREDYGRYRLGGTIGFIIAGLSAGFVFERLGLRLMFPVYGLILGALAVTALMLPKVRVQRESPKREDISRLVRRPEWVLFTASVFLLWITTHSSIMFLPVVMSSMGATQSLIGVAATIGAFVEIPFMLYSGIFLRRYGPRRLLVVAMTLIVIRLFLLGWMPVPAWAVAINLINGPAWVFLWNSSVMYANRMGGPSLAGTAQGLLISTTGLAGVVSSLLSGWLFDLLGPNGLFIVMAFIAISGLVLFTVGTLRQRTTEFQEGRPVD